MYMKILLAILYAVTFTCQVNAAEVKLACKGININVDNNGNRVVRDDNFTFVVVFDSDTNTVNGNKSGQRGYISGRTGRDKDIVNVTDSYISLEHHDDNIDITESINRINGSYEYIQRKHINGTNYGSVKYHGHCVTMKQAF